MTTIADQIRARLDSPRRHVHGSETEALRAVLGECDAMRAASRHPQSLASLIAAQLESVIARELGITPKETL